MGTESATGEEVMTLADEPKRGGYKRTWTNGSPLSVGLFIHAHLPGVPHQIYTEFKQAVQSKPSADFLRLAYRRIRSSIVRKLRTKKGERIKVSQDEIESWLPTYMSGGTESKGGLTLTFNKHPSRLKQHVCSYNSFMHYIYMLRRLGLIEDSSYEDDKLNNPENLTVAAGKGPSGSTEWHEAHPSGTIRATADGEGSPDWVNFQEVYRSRTG